MIAAAAALLLLAAGSEPSLKPGLGSSADTNIRFAFCNVCMPWLRSGAPVPVGWGVSTWGSGPVTRFKRMGVHAHVVGYKGDVNVGVHTATDGLRKCEIDVNDGVPSEIRAILLDEAAKSSEGFAPAKTPYTTDLYANRDFLCQRGPDGRLGVFMSTTADNSKDKPKVTATVADGGSRASRCDAAGPPVNYTPSSSTPQ